MSTKVEEPEPTVTVFVVDDDADSRESVCALVQAMGLRAEAYASARAFLENYREDRPGCLVADVRMPEMDGLELQEELSRRSSSLPIIMITAYATTGIAVRAVKSGAITLLDKPYRNDELEKAIREGVNQCVAERVKRCRQQDFRSRLEALTPDQRRVLDLVVAGKPNKVIAKTLDLGLRTVESHRHKLLSTMQAGSVAELVRIVVEADLESQRN